MSDAITLLANELPTWVTLVGRSDRQLLIETAGTHRSGQPLRQYRISIAAESDWAGGVMAREADESRLLPTNCMQRHMNTDGSFCIGHGAPWQIVDSTTASHWWTLLLGYLQCQDIANVTRRWPPNRGLSHGDAAAVQLKAEALAAELGLLVKYREAIEYGAPWPPADVPDSDGLQELLRLERERRRIDRDFRRHINYPCCATMDDCPIAQSAK